jgi:hypothetical protein
VNEEKVLFSWGRAEYLVTIPEFLEGVQDRQIAKEVKTWRQERTKGNNSISV